MSRGLGHLTQPHVFHCTKLLPNSSCQLKQTEDSSWCPVHSSSFQPQAQQQTWPPNTQPPEVKCLDPAPGRLSSYGSEEFALTCPHARQWCLLLVSALKGSLHFMHMVTSLSRIHLGARFPSSAF